MKYLVGMLLFLLPLLTYAAEPECTPQDYTQEKPPPNFNCPSPLEETLMPKPEAGPKSSEKLTIGQNAPWEGILMDKDRVIQLGLRIMAVRRLRWNDTLKYQGMISAEKKLALDTKAADLKLATDQRDSYKTQLDETKKELEKERAWYRSWTFGLIVGVVATSATAITLAYVARK